MATFKSVSIRLATVLAGSITVILSGLLLATPSAAFAYYGAIPNYSLPTYQACSGRYDSNCLIEVTNYLNGGSYQTYQNNLNAYQYPSQNSYNTANGYVNQSQYSYNTPSYYGAIPYSNSVIRNGYYPQTNYQYSQPAYSYSAPSYQYQSGYSYNYNYSYQNGQQPTYYYSYGY